MIHTHDRAPDLTRVRIFIVLLSLSLFAILSRLWYLQVAHGDELQEASVINQRRLIRRMPPRGKIGARRGRVLASNRLQIVVSVVPYEIKKNPEVLPLLAQLLNRPLTEIEDDLEPFKKNGSYDAVAVAEDVDIKTVTRLE